MHYFPNPQGIISSRKMNAWEMLRLAGGWAQCLSHFALFLAAFLPFTVPMVSEGLPQTPYLSPQIMLRELFERFVTVHGGREELEFNGCPAWPCPSLSLGTRVHCLMLALEVDHCSNLQMYPSSLAPDRQPSLLGTPMLSLQVGYFCKPAQDT